MSKIARRLGRPGSRPRVVLRLTTVAKDSPPRPKRCSIEATLPARALISKTRPNRCSRRCSMQHHNLRHACPREEQKPRDQTLTYFLARELKDRGPKTTRR